MKKWTVKENIEALVGFVLFSIFIFVLGWSIGVFDYDIREDGWTEIIHHKPSGESRY